MKLGIGRSVAITAFALMLFAQGASAAALSTPTLSSYTPKPSSVRFMVMAGATGAEGGFTVEWIKKADYDLNGGWPAAGDLRIQHGDFTGVPVWVTDGTAGDYTLPPTKWMALELGELFDESGVTANSTSELEANTQYVVRVTAKGYGTYTNSAPTSNMVVQTSPPTRNCTFTQGYWKNHEENWPVSSLTLGSVVYTKAQLLDILNEPAQGNGLLILAHQLIAAKLNIAYGADPSAAASTIAAADAQIGALVIPPVGSGFLAPNTVNAKAKTLDDYNNGIIGPGHCATVPANVTTWGKMKSMYRQ
jgi:hypothetical protein